MVERFCSPAFFKHTMLMVCSVIFFLLSGCAQEYDGEISYGEQCLEKIELKHNELNIYPVLLSQGFFPTFICNSGDFVFCYHFVRNDNGKCLRQYLYDYKRKKPRKSAQ